MSDSVKKFFKAIKDVKSKKAPQNPDLVSLMMSALSAIAGAMSVAQMQETNNLLRKIKQILLLKEINNIKPAIGTLDQATQTLDQPTEEKKGQGELVTHKYLDERKQSREAMLFGLEKLTTSKMCPVLKKRVFLLHRPTVTFEYDKAKTEPDVERPYPTNTSLPNSDSIAQKSTENTVEYTTYKDTEWLVDPVVAENNRNNKNPIVAVWIPESDIKDIKGSKQGIGAWGELGANADKDIVVVIVKPGKYKIYSELKA